VAIPTTETARKTVAEENFTRRVTTGHPTGGAVPEPPRCCDALCRHELCDRLFPRDLDAMDLAAMRLYLRDELVFTALRRPTAFADHLLEQWLHLLAAGY
jgi:hypothetical protein